MGLPYTTGRRLYENFVIGVSAFAEKWMPDLSFEEITKTTTTSGDAQS